MAAVPATNHVHDPWPSIMGTAGHAWMEGALLGDNERRGLRWLPERKVQDPSLPGNPGTGDAYDGKEACVDDWKFLGKTTLEKLRRHGPPLHYRVQLKIYGAGFAALGLPVTRIVLVAFPRTESSIDRMYVWEEAWRPDDPELAWVYKVTPAREAAAQLVAAGFLDLMQIPAKASNDDCTYCPFYRPDGSAGCPGLKGLPT
jgi:hypothetical protein